MAKTCGNVASQQYTRISDIVNEPQEMLMPIEGYEEMPIVPLEEAVAPLISILPKIQTYIYVAKQRCKSVPPDDLTQDESASIMLYSMEWKPHKECLYFALNAALRSEDRRELESWFSYLKLILTALEKIPSTRCHVFRGVNLDLTNQYIQGKRFVWWGFSSCTTSIEILENQQFLGRTGQRTLFTIECDSGKDISRHSYYQKEKEVLLLPARQFIVVGCLQPAPSLHMIQLKEAKPPINLLQPITKQSAQVKPTPSLHMNQLKETKPLITLSQPVTNQFVQIKSTPTFYQSNHSTIGAATISKNSITTNQISTQSQIKHQQILTENNKYQQFAVTVAGGNGKGDQLNQLSDPLGICIDDDKSIYVADSENHRIVKSELNSKTGQITAGGNGSGNQNNQLHGPTDIIFDKQNNFFIISEWENKRVIRYFDPKLTNPQIIISNITCYGLTIDKNRFIYASDWENHEVRRWKQGDRKGELVAGGNGQGNHPNQLNGPTKIFIDDDYSLYISDYWNHRVMKWKKDAKEGIIVAGGNGKGNSLKQLSLPYGVIVDHLGQIYVADWANHRIMRWCEGDEEGEIVIGKNGRGNESNQLNFPTGLSFDNEENLYVVDQLNHRIQKYEKM
ncbi:unnamed protein product [Adineta steineri]|uniref:NAD(P)(+)--arginine ADP-ribosyltransferase n=1 Tax=Adineta steineri TaxID=433720 RepID=A0A815JS79_9BILA|nr:unnamed protein product [Adineta steineri]CAF1386098.1 unnamed protein product [Adineta steineri]